MLRFTEFCQLHEAAAHPTWVKGLVIWFGLQTASLEQQIANEEDPRKRDQLLARQNRLLAYMTGLGIAIDTKDKGLLTRMRSRARR
jgi:hypothetical protein